MTVFASQFVGESNVLPAQVEARDEQGLIVSVERRADRGGRAAPGPGRPIGLGVDSAEKYRLEETTQGAMDNVFPAEVIDSVFLGVLVRDEVRLDQGVRLTVLEGYREDRPILGPGAAVMVAWQREHCLVLTA